MKLNEEADVGYSNRDRTLFSIISRNGKISSVDITRKFYGRKSPIPLNGQRIVYGDIRMLKKKIELNKEPFRIASTVRSGPIPMVFWIEKRK